MKYNVKIIGTINKVIDADNFTDAVNTANAEYADGIWNMLDSDIDTDVEVYPDGQEKKVFDVDFLETFYEVVAAFYSTPESSILETIEETKGRGGMWEYAQQLTEDFFVLYPNTDWGHELDYHDTLENFLKDKL